MTADLVAFLNRALDEEAETAPHSHRRGCELLGYFPYATAMSGSALHEQCDCDGPQATLDRVEATRAVVAMHRPFTLDKDAHAPYGYMTYSKPTGDQCACGSRLPCPTLRALASAYRRHPDYNEAWLSDGVEVTA